MNLILLWKICLLGSLLYSIQAALWYEDTLISEKDISLLLQYRNKKLSHPTQSRMSVRDLLDILKRIKAESVNTPEDIIADTTLPNKRDIGAYEHICIPRDALVSTYTFERGSQRPRTVQVKRCQGGVQNPENYQCQPTVLTVKCFHTINHHGNDDYIGAYSHSKCEERCICNRKSCQGEKIFKLQCPNGFKEDSQTCQCRSLTNRPIFYRNMGIIEHWSTNLNKACSIQADQYKVKVGDSFTIDINV